jgi:3-dehydroquinate synthetase
MRAATREALARRALTLLVDIDVDEAWRRVAVSRYRPLAQDERGFRELYRERAPVYRETADAVVVDTEDALLACGDVIVEEGALARLRDVLPEAGSVALIADERVLGLHPLGPDERIVQTLTVPSGEEAKQLPVCRKLWDELTIDRTGAIVALGGGTTTDVAGFVAATYLRGVPWVPVPTTLVGQVDAAIGGKTGIDLAKGKNLVGAFHLPVAVVADPRLLDTLPEERWREGLAEVVKTGLLAGRELWSLAPTAMVRACAAFKVSVCLADPTEQGRRAILNLGHTFAHGLEAAAGYATISHGHAVALGLRAALLLSERHLGLDPAVRQEVESILPVERAAVDGAAAWAAMALDKKARGGTRRLVLLQKPGSPVYGVELPPDEIRGALATLVAA